MGLLYFSINNFVAFERAYGEELSQHVLHLMQVSIKETCKRLLDQCDLVHTERLADSSLITIFRNGDLNLKNLADLAMTFRLDLRRSVNQALVKLTGQKLEIKAGYAKMRPQEGVEAGHTLFQTLCDAQQVAVGTFNISKLRLMDEFRQILEQPRLTAVYMPIVDLRSSRVLGMGGLGSGAA